MPAPPSGRDTVVRKKRRCKGCHGYDGPLHESYPLDARKCTLDHSESCEGGIVAGIDAKGREWRGCPQDFVPSGEIGEFEEEYEHGYSSDDLQHLQQQF